MVENVLLLGEILLPMILIVYDTKTGNTEKMAKAVLGGVKRTGVEYKLKGVENCNLDDLKSSDGIIFGSPTHFGTMSKSMNGLITKSHDIRKEMKDKIGGAFTSAASVGGGNETALMSLIQAMLKHAMIVVGTPSGHYGAVSLGSPGEDNLEECRRLGERIGNFVKKQG